MNDVKLMGRLTKEPDVRLKEDGTVSMARFTLAVDRKMKKQEGQTADFISCVAFGSTAGFIKAYVHKGTKIVVARGRLQTGSYIKADGKKEYTTDVVVEEIEFAESKKKDEATTSAPAQPQAQPMPPQQPMYGQPMQPQAPAYPPQQAVYQQMQPAYGQPQQPMYGQQMQPQAVQPVQQLPIDADSKVFL